jgi:hypothetical protein
MSDYSTILRKNTCAGSREQPTDLTICHWSSRSSPFPTVDGTITALQTTKVSFCRKKRGSLQKMKDDARKRGGSRPNHNETRLKNAPVRQLSWNSYATATTYSPDL